MSPPVWPVLSFRCFGSAWTGKERLALRREHCKTAKLTLVLSPYRSIAVDPLVRLQSRSDSGGLGAELDRIIAVNAQQAEEYRAQPQESYETPFPPVRHEDKPGHYQRRV